MFINYDLQGCKIIAAASKRVLATIDCREVSAIEKQGGFIGSGITSEIATRTVATATAFNFVTHNQNIIIDGELYKIIGIGTFRDRAIGKSILKAQYQSKETILRLQA